jgi:hypothetical protein
LDGRLDQRLAEQLTNAQENWATFLNLQGHKNVITLNDKHLLCSFWINIPSSTERVAKANPPSNFTIALPVQPLHIP